MAHAPGFAATRKVLTFRLSPVDGDLFLFFPPFVHERGLRRLLASEQGGILSGRRGRRVISGGGDGGVSHQERSLGQGSDPPAAPPPFPTPNTAPALYRQALSSRGLSACFRARGLLRPSDCRHALGEYAWSSLEPLLCL